MPEFFPKFDNGVGLFIWIEKDLNGHVDDEVIVFVDREEAMGNGALWPPLAESDVLKVDRCFEFHLKFSVVGIDNHTVKRPAGFVQHAGGAAVLERCG